MTTLFKKKYMRVPHLSLSRTIKEMGNNPFVDWIGVLAITATISVFLIAGGVYLYWQVTTGVIQSSDDTSLDASKKFDQKSLTSAIDHIEEKEAASSQAKRGYSGPPDPSL